MFLKKDRILIKIYIKFKASDWFPYNTNYSTKFKSCYASKFQEALNLLENMHISFLDECKGLVIFLKWKNYSISYEIKNI